MFLKNSRYQGLSTVSFKDRGGREVVAVKLRRLPSTEGDLHIVKGSDQLDIMSEGRYRDSTRYWHIADANSELEAAELTRRMGRQIKIPKR